MIELFDDYVILVNDLDYALARKTKYRNPKTGKIKYDNIGYFGTVQAALERMVDIYTRDVLKDRSLPLSEAVQAIRESHGRVTKLIETAMEVK